MDEIAEKPSQSPEEIRKGIEACWKEVAARPTSPIFQRLMEQERSDATRSRPPALEPREPPGPPEPAKPAAEAPKPKPQEAKHVKALRKALTPLEAESEMIRKEAHWGHLKGAGARAFLLGLLTAFPIMLLMRRFFL